MLKVWLRKPLVIGVLVISVILGIVFWRCLPSPLFDSPYSAILVDRHGELLGAKIALDQQWRFPETETVPAKFRLAATTFEDKRFYRHPGVDPLALARAFYLNIKKQKVVSGGSTISMQVIRLARQNPPRTYYEKLLEMLMTLRLELSFSKDEILALYASHAPFGGNVVGLDAAAWRYFGRDAQHLSWAEYCTLAVLPNNPALIHLGRNRAALKRKRDALLVRLHQHGALSDMDLQLAQLELLPVKPKAMPRDATHLLETLVLQQGKPARFVSTLDKQLQRNVNRILHLHARTLRKQAIGNLAAVVLDNRTFEVLAYIGNTAPSSAEAAAPHVDLIQSPRSTGSILKPFLYTAMLESGDILPSTLVSDVPTDYGGYVPQNYDKAYRGAIPAREALARSLNIPAVRMLNRFGVSRFYDFLQGAGMSTLFRTPTDYGLTLVLGGAEAKLWDITSLFGNLAHVARAETSAPIYFQKPKLLLSDNAATQKIAEYSPASAWLTLRALVEVNRPGVEGHWRNFSSSRPIAWKTGTSFGLRDAWAVGTTNGYTVGLWAGNADGEGNSALTGTATAAPSLFDIFNSLETTDWFERPTADMRLVKVCKNDGYLASDACVSMNQWIPKNSHFQQISPHHQLVHLDQAGLWQVHSGCQPLDKMQHLNWFVLPPGEAFYYRKNHPEYRPLPQFRRDCQKLLSSAPEHNPLELIYPREGSQIYIPTDLGGVRAKTVFNAANENTQGKIFWHLDNEFLGATETFHQFALDLIPGEHQITLVDEQGNRLTHHFRVLGKADN